MPNNKQKIRIVGTDEVFGLSDFCDWEIRDGILWNLNTNHDEGVEGDIVEYQDKGNKYRGCVDMTPTLYQLIHTKEYGGVILSTQEYDVNFTHLNKVEFVD